MKKNYSTEDIISLTENKNFFMAKKLLQQFLKSNDIESNFF